MADCACFILYDPYSNLVLMENRPDLRNQEGDYLIFPGGKVEPEEKPHDAMARECIEETGCFPLVYKLLNPTLELRSRFNQPGLPDDFEGWRVFAYLAYSN